MPESDVAQSVQSDERRILQEHYGLAILDRARTDHLQRRGQRQFHYLDILALGGIASTRGHAILRLIFGNEEVQLLGDGPGTHVCL
jgi:hypothetical protein